MKITFMLAAATYIYLPIFLAKEKGIFKSVFEPNRIDGDIDIEICKGDDDAVEKMLKYNRRARKEKKDEMAVAISDPTSILLSYNGFDNKSDIRFIAKLIDKLPFWIICSYKDDLKENPHNGYMDIKELQATELFIPNSNYITANSCRHELFRIGKYHVNQVEFSQEVDKCIVVPKSIALTGDLNLMARRKIEKKISILGHMAYNNDNNGMATAVITSKYVCKKYDDILSYILEAIQKAIFIIYSSPEIAIEVCDKIGSTIDIHIMQDKEQQKQKTETIISIINSDHLYPMSMSISYDEWKKTVNYYLSNDVNIFRYLNDKNAPKNPHENESYVADIYKKMYFKEAANMAEINMVKDFGVDCNTFNKEIPYHVLNRVADNLCNFFRRKVWYILSFILFVFVTIYVILQIFYNKNRDIVSNLGLYIGVLSLIWGVFSHLNRKKSI